MVEQNVLYASILAIVGGCLQVAAVLILAYPDYQKTHHNKKYSETFERLLVPINIIVQILIGFVNTVSTWYGPISIVMPMRVSAQLMFNMLFFGWLGIEEFPKEVQVGTYIVVSGAFLLPIVGPTAQNGQDPVQLLEMPASEMWTIMLFVVTGLSGLYCVIFITEKTKIGVVRHLYKFPILLTARVASAVLSTSISKFLVSTSGIGFAMTVSAFVACSIVISSVAVLQATEVDQSIFVPASACGIQFLNSITGLVIWQDWRVIQSCPGYSIVMIQILLGVYLISSVEQFSNSADTDYALAQSITIQTAKGISLFINQKEGKHSSIAGYAGGNLHAMIHEAFPETESNEYIYDLSHSHAPTKKKKKKKKKKKNLDRYLKAHNATGDDSLLSFENDQSSVTPSFMSYGTIHTNQMFSEEFDV